MMGWTRGKSLGKGSYGEVFIAIPHNPNIPLLAVKSAPEARAGSLVIEQQILERFRGVPGVIQCFGAEITQSYLMGGAPRTYNLLLEYAPRGSLANLIARGPGIPEPHVKVYTRMILQALSSIHARGFTHCDIKPDNILVFPPSAENRGGKGLYELKVADFGLAMETWNLIPGGKNYRGTTRYMPPEGVMYGEVSPAMDIWAVGCTVVEMLTGKLPWSECKEKEEVVRGIGEGRAPEIPDWVSEQGKDFLRMCFARNSSHRQNVDMFLRHRFVADCGVIGSGMKKTASSTAVNGGGGIVFEQWGKQRSPVFAAPCPMLRHELFQQGRPAVLMF